MSEEFRMTPLDDLYEITRGCVCPFLFPNEEFIHHSLPAFDEHGGPSIEYGRNIESNKTLLIDPVILLSKLNPRIPRVSLADPSNDNRRHCCSTEFIAYRKKSAKLCNDFYKYYFQTDEFRNRLKNVATGTTNSHVRVTPSETLHWDVPRPPQREQTKIAEVLSTVDRAIEQTEALIAKQQRIKTGLMQDLLTRGIDEHGNLRSEETHEFKDSPLGRVPLEWGITKLDDIATFVTSGSRGWARYYSNEGALFIRIGNLKRHTIDIKLDDLVFVDPPESSEGQRTSVIAGDLLISITADLGIIGVAASNLGEAYVNQHIALVRLSDRVDSRFIGWYLSGNRGQEQFDNLNESGAKAGLNLPTVRGLSVPIPSLPEQQSISKQLDLLSAIEAEHIKNLQKLRLEKAGLMQDLLTGKKRVTSLLEPSASSGRTP